MSASSCRGSVPMILVRGWAGGIFEPATAREPIDQAVEPAVIEGFQIHDVLIEKHLAFDDRKVHPVEARLGLDRRTIEQQETLEPRGSLSWDRWDREVDCPSRRSFDRRAAPPAIHRGCGSASSIDRNRLMSWRDGGSIFWHRASRSTESVVGLVRLMYRRSAATAPS